MPNLFKQFRDLLPETDSRNIGVVQSVNSSNNTTTLATLGGGSVIVLGVGVSVGSKAFYKGGRLEGAAPSLPAYEIEV